MKKFKITFTKVLEVEGKDKKSAIKEAELLFKHYHMDEIPVKAVEIREKKKGAIPSKLKPLMKAVKDYGIDGILFDDDTFVYQYRINGADCNATCYAGKKVVDDNYDVTMEIANLLHNKIKKAYMDGYVTMEIANLLHNKIKKAYMDGYVEGKDILELLLPLGVKCYASKFGKEMSFQTLFEVEGGSDS